MVEWITPVEVTPGSTGWQDVDCSSYIPSGATGVILHFVNTSYSFYTVGWRKNGSTDTTSGFIAEKGHFWCAIGVDASRICEVYVSNTSNMDVYLVGYFTSDASFFDNAVDKSLGSTGSWIDIDISADTGGDTAIGAVFQIKATGAGQSYGLRKNGSSDSRIGDVYRLTGAIIGVDGSEICEGQINDTSIDFFLVGYIVSGSTFNTNATDVSLGTTDSWTDLTALPAGANGGYIELHNSSGSYGLRRNGSSENIYNRDNYSGKLFGLIGCDAGGIIEGKISSTLTDFFIIGYGEGVTFTKTFTIDGLLQKTQSKTFSADAILINQITKTFTADAILESPVVTKTFTADALLEKTSTKTFTLDALLEKTFTKTFTADGLLQDTFTKTFTSNALLEKQDNTKTFTVDALIRKVDTKTLTVDALLQDTFTKTFTADAVVGDVILKQFTADAILKATQTKTFITNALVKQQNITKVLTTDALIQQQNLTKTFTIDAMLLEVKTKTFTADSLLQKTLTKTLSINAVLLKTQTKEFVVDASLRTQNTKTFVIDALLAETYTKTFTADAVLTALALDKPSVIVEEKKPTIVIEEQKPITLTRDVKPEMNTKDVKPKIKIMEVKPVIVIGT